MRVLAILLGVGTAVGIAAGVSPAPAASSIQLAQAQDSAAPSGAGAGASQRGSAGNREGGNREGGAAATGGSQERGAATRPSGDPSATTRSETKRTSHTTVRERAGGTRVSVHGSTRRVVGVRAAAGDDAVVIRRKRARTHVYSEPSTTVIRKKRYVHYREPSSTVVIKKRRPAVAVEGVSTRTTVRSQHLHDGARRRRNARECRREHQRSRALLRRRQCRRALGRTRWPGNNHRPLRWRRTRPKIGNRYRRRGRQPLALAFWLARRDAPAREPDTWRIRNG